MRPLISTGDPKKSVDISRKAELYETSSGMITITGGKLTTWRRMAKMTVDRLVEREAREAACRTHEIPLGQAVAPESLPRVEGVAPEAYAALAGRYGHGAHEVLALAGERGRAGPADRRGLPRTCWPRSCWPPVASRPAPSATSCCGAPAWACLRPAELTGDSARGRVRSARGARRVGDVLARELGWDEARLEHELAAFAQEARAEGIAPSGRAPSRPRRSPTAAL